MITYKTLHTQKNKKIKNKLYTVPVDQNEYYIQLYKMIDAHAHLLGEKEISERVVFVLWKMVKNYK